MIQKKLFAADAANVVAALSAGDITNLPWGHQGRFGRVFVTRRYLHVTRALETTVHLDGIPLLSQRDNGSMIEYFDDAEERSKREALRASRRAAQAAYLGALERAAELLSEGREIRFTEGQRGGYFTLPSGENVSAPGVLRRLGISSQDLTCEEIEDWVCAFRPAPRLGRRSRENPVTFDAVAAG